MKFLQKFLLLIYFRGIEILFLILNSIIKYFFFVFKLYLMNKYLLNIYLNI